MKPERLSARTEIRAEEARWTGGRGEAGSAYIAVLVVLVVLTVLALALSLVTQTEMQIGSNERTVSRVFYSADAGIQLGEGYINQYLAPPPTRTLSYLSTDSGLQLVSNKLQLGSQVTVTFGDPEDGESNLTAVNATGTGQYGKPLYVSTTFPVASKSARFATFDTTARNPLSEKTVSVHILKDPKQAVPPPGTH